MPELTITLRVPWPKHRSMAALEKAIPLVERMVRTVAFERFP